MTNNYDVIIVNYNGETILEPCLQSVIDSSVSPKKVIVVDNDSKDKSVQLIKEKFPNVYLIESRKNLGFGNANNIGLEHTESKNILFINNDVILDKYCAEKMLSVLSGDEKMAIVNPLIIRGWDRKDKSRIYSYGAILDSTGFGYSITTISSDGPNCFSGACFMSKTDFIKEATFEKRFFMYYEEPDISIKLLKLGLKIGRTKEGICYHLENFSSPKKHADGIAFRQYMAVQNRWYMIGKNWPFILFPRAITINCLHLLYLLFFFLKNKKFKNLDLFFKAPSKLILGLLNRDSRSPKNQKWYLQLRPTSVTGYLLNKKEVFDKKS